jgi:outer membrane protein
VSIFEAENYIRMKIFINALFVLSCVFFLQDLKAQEKWSLSRCITHAHENNIQIKQAYLNAELANANLWQAKASTLPTLNGNASHAYNYGRTIDPFTNQFATDLIRSNNFALSSNFNLFSGFQNFNQVRQSQLEFLAARYDAERTANDISLNIATAYLQILFAEELLIIAENQVNITQQQVERSKKLVEAGALARGGLLEVEAQLATEDLQLVNARNQLDLSVLTLKQLLDLPPGTPFNIERPVLNMPTGNLLSLSPEVISAHAQTIMPEIRSAELRVRSSQKSLLTARGGASPRLFLSGSLGTGFSGLRQRVVDLQLMGIQTIGQTQGGENVFAPLISPVFERIPFNEQINDNFNQSFGFFLTVPIFNGLQTRTTISRAKIARYNAEYHLQLAELQLNRNVQQAYADAVAAFKRHAATERALDALRESFKYAEQRFNVGALNALDYNNAKNRLVSAESDKLQAKYDYIFKLKVLDFYQGKPLTLE